MVFPNAQLSGSPLPASGRGAGGEGPRPRPGSHRVCARANGARPTNSRGPSGDGSESWQACRTGAGERTDAGARELTHGPHSLTPHPRPLSPKRGEGGRRN